MKASLLPKGMGKLVDMKNVSRATVPRKLNVAPKSTSFAKISVHDEIGTVVGGVGKSIDKTFRMKKR